MGLLWHAAECFIINTQLLSQTGAVSLHLKVVAPCRNVGLWWPTLDILDMLVFSFLLCLKWELDDGKRWNLSQIFCCFNVLCICIISPSVFQPQTSPTRNIYFMSFIYSLYYVKLNFFQFKITERIEIKSLE